MLQITHQNLGHKIELKLTIADVELTKSIVKKFNLKLTMLKSCLCYYSNAYILVKGTIYSNYWSRR